MSKVSIFCYWGGDIINTHEGLSYSVNKYKVMRIYRDTNYEGLKEKVFEKMGISSDRFRLKLICRLPSLNLNNKIEYIGMEVEDDDSVETMFAVTDVPGRIFVELYIKVEEKVALEPDELRRLHGLNLRSARRDRIVAPYITAWGDRLSVVQDGDLFVGRMPYGDPYMQWYRHITRSSIRSLLHIIGDGFQSSAPVVRVMLEAIVKCYARGSQIQDEEILRICRTTMITIGLGDQILDHPPPIRDSAQVQHPQMEVERVGLGGGGGGGGRRGGRGRGRGRGRFGPTEPAYHPDPVEFVPQHHLEIPDPIEVPQHYSEIPDASPMSLESHADISPASSPAPPSASNSSILSQDTPSSFAPLPFVQNYQRQSKRHRSPDISTDVGQPNSSTQLDIPFPFRSLLRSCKMPSFLSEDQREMQDQFFTSLRSNVNDNYDFFFSNL